MKFSGSWIRALDTGSIDLFERDVVERVSMDINTSDVLIWQFWPTLIWRFNVDDNNEFIWWTFVVISLENFLCWWIFRLCSRVSHVESLPSVNRSIRDRIFQRNIRECLTQIGPFRFDISIIIIRKYIGTCCINTKNICSLLQWSIDSLKFSLILIIIWRKILPWEDLFRIASDPWRSIECLHTEFVLKNHLI